MSQLPPRQRSTSPSQAAGRKRSRREDVRAVAQYQKAILICILVYFVAAVCRFFLPAELRIFLLTGVLGLGVVATVFVFLLAIRLYSTGVGVLLGILTLIPCVGLIVLLIVNGKATGFLQQNGIKVGLLGANLSEI